MRKETIASRKETRGMRKQEKENKKAEKTGNAARLFLGGKERKRVNAKDSTERR